MALDFFGSLSVLGPEVTLSLFELELTPEEAFGLRQRLHQCVRLFRPIHDDRSGMNGVPGYGH